MITRTTPARLAAVAIALLLVGGTAACGTSSGDDDATDTTTTEAKATTTDGGDEPTTTTEAEETTTTEGGDDPIDADAQAYVDAVVDDLGSSDSFATKEEATCLAEGWVDILGADELQAAGIEPDEFSDLDNEALDALDLSKDEAGALFDQFGECDLDLRDIFSSFYAGEDGPTAEEQACVEELLPDDALRESFIADFFGEEVEDDPVEQVETCFPNSPLAGGADDTPVTVGTTTPGN